MQKLINLLKLGQDTSPWPLIQVSSMSLQLAAVIEEVTRFQNPMYNLEPDGAVSGNLKYVLSHT